MQPYRTPGHINRRLPSARINFQALWTMLIGAADLVNDLKFKALLTNHVNRQEYICRKLGVICSADVARISAKLKKPIEPPKSVNLLSSNVRSK